MLTARGRKFLLVCLYTSVVWHSFTPCFFSQYTAQGEYKIEVIRQLLVGKPNYNAYQLFKAVDSDNTEFISRQNLKDFLFKYNFYLNDDDAYALIRRYTNTDGFSITYKEFFKTLAFPVVSPIDV